MEYNITHRVRKKTMRYFPLAWPNPQLWLSRRCNHLQRDLPGYPTQGPSGHSHKDAAQAPQVSSLMPVLAACSLLTGSQSCVLMEVLDHQASTQFVTRCAALSLHCHWEWTEVEWFHGCSGSTFLDESAQRSECDVCRFAQLKCMESRVIRLFSQP